MKVVDQCRCISRSLAVSQTKTLGVSGVPRRSVVWQRLLYIQGRSCHGIPPNLIQILPYTIYNMFRDLFGPTNGFSYIVAKCQMIHASWIQVDSTQK